MAASINDHARKNLEALHVALSRSTNLFKKATLTSKRSNIYLFIRSNIYIFILLYFLVIMYNSLMNRFYPFSKFLYSVNVFNSTRDGIAKKGFTFRNIICYF